MSGTLRSRRGAKPKEKALDAVPSQPASLKSIKARGDHFYHQRKRHAPRLVELYDTNIFVQIIVAYNRFVQEGILQALFCGLTIFEAIACLMTLCFELTSLGDILQNYNIVGIFLILEFFLAFSFRDTVKESNQRYIKAPTHYRHLLDKILGIAKTMPRSIDNRYQISPEDQQRIARLFAYVRWANFFTLPIFSEVHRIVPIFMDNAMYHFLSVDMLCDFTKPETIIEALMFSISQRAGELHNSKILDQSQENTIVEATEEVSKILEQIRITKEIASPPMMQIVSMGIIIIFILVVIPLQIYSTIGVLTPVFFPIIAILFSSYFFFAYFYNDPFSPYTHYRAMDFVGWRSENRDAIITYEGLLFRGLGYAGPPRIAWDTAS